MATYLNQDKNAILNEIGGGIEYYDVVIKTTFTDLEESTDSYKQYIQSKDITQQLEKATKALNIYLIIDDEFYNCIGRYNKELVFGINLANVPEMDNAYIYRFYYEDNKWYVNYTEY